MLRREFLKRSLRILVSTLGAFSILGFWSFLVKRNPAPLHLHTEPAVLRPPGALEESKFLAKCIRCQRCANACKRGAIRLALPNEGFYLGTPFILSRETGCDLCLSCTHSCPTGALLVVEKEEDVRMGTAVVDQRICVSHNGSGVCGACYTICPFKNKAISQGKYNAPVVNPASCVGCGLCEEACITEGKKAIRVYSKRGKR